MSQEIINELSKEPGVVLLDFYKDDCGPCKLMAPTVEAVDRDYPDVKIGYINVDQYPQVAARYNVQAFPTLVILKDGVIQSYFMGRTAAGRLRAAIDAALK